MPTWLVVVVLIVLVIVGPFLAIASGRASGERLRTLGDDLSHGRPRGYAVVAGAVGFFVLIQIINSIS